MLGRISRQRQGDVEGGAQDQQPLLNDSQEDLHHSQSESVIFSVNDEDDEYVEASALDATEESPLPKSGHSVRFQEDVQVIGPSLRSMTESRETRA